MVKWEWFTELARSLADREFLQGLVAALCTFILEDPTTVGCGLLVADGKMTLTTALVGVALGIALGDVGLYGIGRLLGPKTVRWGLISPNGMKRAHRWFERNPILAVVGSRFLPGMRLPVYLGAGNLKASPHKFLLVVIVASFVWTLLLLQLTIRIGQTILPYMGHMKWVFMLSLIVLVIAIQIKIRGGSKKTETSEEELEEPVVSAFEFWPPWLFYIPIAFYWLWLAVRFRGLLLPTVVNPAIYASGFVVESKSQIFSLVPESVSRWVAPCVVFERPRSEDEPDALLQQARRALDTANLSYPVVAKPDIGQRGAGVQLVKNDAQLSKYLEEFPPGQKIILQQLVNGSREAGILYYRKPDETRGSILSITLKVFPRVLGDGKRTLRQLILDDRRANLIQAIYFRRHADRLDRVLADGKEFPPVFAENHCQGAIFKNGNDEATPELLERIEQIAAAIPEFYFGRFDVRFDSLETLRGGEGFQIVEINGAGTEATHIWDARAKLGEAYADLRRQFRILFEIGAANRRRGFRCTPVGQFFKDLRSVRRMVRDYPPTS